ncbi:ABC transporter permease [Rhodovarius lipocyclicus]|uniref:ABC transporter permease n=1 Tax=Rhodovarius lipocyclicus TaxID=268410 RepID=UPI0013583A6A|nr:ABC transporter permease [Rhodovarius lipocyclicus]
MRRPSSSLAGFARVLVAHRELIFRLVVREVGSRFRGSTLGPAWAVLTPLLTAAVFTFVFSTVFQSRWGGSTGRFDFALLMLSGLIIHNIFSESVGRAPTLLLANTSYVTKVIFPIEILPVVATLSTLVNAVISAAIVLVGDAAFNGHVSATAFLFPVVLLPFLFFVVGLGLLLAALGVFLRDLTQIVTLLITLTMFLTPIFYPLEAVPPAFRTAMHFNPLTFIVGQVRAVLVFGQWPNFTGLALYTLAALAVLAFCYWVFQRLRQGFADVL